MEQLEIRTLGSSGYRGRIVLAGGNSTADPKTTSVTENQSIRRATGNPDAQWRHIPGHLGRETVTAQQAGIRPSAKRLRTGRMVGEAALTRAAEQQISAEDFRVDVTKDGRCHPEHGRVELTDIPRERWSPSPANGLLQSKLLCRWNPPKELAGRLPSWYDLGLCCDVARDGSRRFSPLGDDLAGIDSPSEGLRYAATTEGLMTVASVGGEALLACQVKEESPSLLTYGQARLFRQYVSHMREHFGDTIRLHGVLGLCSGARSDRGMKHILPPDLGRDAQGFGDPWGPNALKQEGLCAARSAGLANMNAEDILRLGLLTAAKRRPVMVADADTESLVRLTLFDLHPSDKPLAADELAYVVHHVITSIRDHLSDSTSDFDTWIQDPKSNLIHRIAKRKDCQLDRQHIRTALLQLGWESIKLTGQCIDAQMRAFRCAMPEALSASEQLLFDQIYVGLAPMGGLPLLLLRDRFPFLREAILERWNAPTDSHAVGVIHAMMYYYGYMLNTRRSSDRHYKQLAQLINDNGRTPFVQTLLEKQTTRDDHPDSDDEVRKKTDDRSGEDRKFVGDGDDYATQEYFRDAAIHIANMRGLLPFPIPYELNAQLMSVEGDHIRIRVFVTHLNIDVIVDTTTEELKEAVANLF